VPGGMKAVVYLVVTIVQNGNNVNNFILIFNSNVFYYTID